MNTLTLLEEEVLKMLLDGEEEALSTLRQQLRRATISSRTMTGVGFDTTFAVSSDVPLLPGRPSFRLGDVNGSADNVSHGLGFLLNVKDGALQALEGYTFDEAWPTEIAGLKLTYPDGKRDMEKLRSLIDSSSRGQP